MVKFLGKLMEVGKETTLNDVTQMLKDKYYMYSHKLRQYFWVGFFA